MRGFRLSIAGMLWVVAVVALWVASLRSASVLWLSVAATITLGLLLTAVVGVVLLRGEARAFCLGFALFGWVYLVLVNWDWIGGPIGHDLTGGLSELGDWLLPSAPSIAGPPYFGPGSVRVLSPPPPANIFDLIQQRSKEGLM